MTLLKLKGYKLQMYQVSNIDLLNPDTIHSHNSNSNEDGENQKATEVDNSNLSLTEKNRMLWKDKVSKPYQGSEIEKKIYGRTQAIHPKVEDDLGLRHLSR